MDPDATLERIRELIATGTSSENLDDLLEAVHSFHDLDEWILKGGFLPKDWTRE